jgi:predicted CoA-binding protein
MSGSEAWRSNLVETSDGAREILASARRVAVLGIKPESRADKAAHYVPKYLQEQGYEIIPVPTYYPEVTEILGQPVFREVAVVPGQVDLVDVFRRPNDIPPHVDDIIAKAPGAVWFQLGIRNDAAAERLARAGIKVVQDRCTLADHRRFGLGSPGPEATG